jgi:hypothetical protein
MDQNAAIEAGWRFFLSQQDDVSFAAVVATIRAQCPSVGVERIRAEFKRRLRGWCGPAVEGSGRPVEVPEAGTQGTRLRPRSRIAERVGRSPGFSLSTIP